MTWLKCRAAVVGEPLIRVHVAHRDGLAALEGLAENGPHIELHVRPHERLGAARMFAADDEIAVFELRVAGALHVQVLGELPRGGQLDVRGIA